MFDSHRNLAIETVAIAPVPATEGTTFTLNPGESVRFSPNMPITLTPRLYVDTTATAEIAYVTDVSGDLLTVLRGREDTDALPVSVGWTVVGAATV